MGSAALAKLCKDDTPAVQTGIHSRRTNIIASVLNKDVEDIQAANLIDRVVRMTSKRAREDTHEYMEAFPSDIKDAFSKFRKMRGETIGKFTPSSATHWKEFFPPELSQWRGLADNPYMNALRYQFVVTQDWRAACLAKGVNGAMNLLLLFYGKLSKIENSHLARSFFRHIMRTMNENGDIFKVTFVVSNPLAMTASMFVPGIPLVPLSLSHSRHASRFEMSVNLWRNEPVGNWMDFSITDNKIDPLHQDLKPLREIRDSIMDIHSHVFHLLPQVHFPWNKLQGKAAPHFQIHRKSGYLGNWGLAEELEVMFVGEKQPLKVGRLIYTGGMILQITQLWVSHHIYETIRHDLMQQLLTRMIEREKRGEIKFIIAPHCEAESENSACSAELRSFLRMFNFQWLNTAKIMELTGTSYLLPKSGLVRESSNYEARLKRLSSLTPTETRNSVDVFILDVPEKVNSDFGPDSRKQTSSGLIKAVSSRLRFVGTGSSKRSENSLEFDPDEMSVGTKSVGKMSAIDSGSLGLDSEKPDIGPLPVMRRQSTGVSIPDDMELRADSSNRAKEEVGMPQKMGFRASSSTDVPLLSGSPRDLELEADEMGRLSSRDLEGEVDSAEPRMRDAKAEEGAGLGIREALTRDQDGVMDVEREQYQDSVDEPTYQVSDSRLFQALDGGLADVSFAEPPCPASRSSSSEPFELNIDSEDDASVLHVKSLGPRLLHDDPPPNMEDSRSSSSEPFELNIDSEDDASVLHVKSLGPRLLHDDPPPNMEDIHEPRQK